MADPTPFHVSLEYCLYDRVTDGLLRQPGYEFIESFAKVEDARIFANGENDTHECDESSYVIRDFTNGYPEAVSLSAFVPPPALQTDDLPF